MKFPPRGAVVRDPARHRDLPFDIRVVAGDVTDAVSAERAAAGQDAAVSAAADLSVPAHDFFTASSRALATGLAKAGARHLAVVGLSSVLPGASGAALMDEPGYPNEYRSFSLGHLAGLDEPSGQRARLGVRRSSDHLPVSRCRSRRGGCCRGSRSRTRSPIASGSPGGTTGPASYWVWVVRGRSMPAAR
ncbi:NAD(P)H-binding protein [Parafrankia sp. BMG5.11]|uniref:NAD(P)H-binding protein n=1 Tax=Parafrankia sp. BMG5.11 TaxID=222540 RepID=UPI001FB541E3|nr:NAD(P)H-binding protein [Parafrankia sp. BMG5.11]